jgi:RNA polymerase sigma-70 factor (ECF subfamily)
MIERIPDEEKRLRTGSDALERPSMAAGAIDGDMRCIESLWQENRRWIAAVLLAYKPRSEDLDDLLQEVAMTLVAKINTVRDQANVRAWLRAVAINIARAAGRHGRARPSLRLAGGDAELTIPADHAPFELDDHSHRVLRLVEQLPEAYREPLMLKAVQGMRTRQIAEILDIPEATVDTRISRARRMLRDKVQLEEHEASCAAASSVLRQA